MDPVFYSGDASSFDPMFSGVSLQSLLSLNPCIFSDGFPTLTSLTDDPNLPQSADYENKKKHLVPKTEHPHHHVPVQQQQQQQQQQSFNFLIPKYQQQPYDHRKRHRLDDSSLVGGKAVVPSVIPQSNLARQRRQKLSEKTRCLQKLMPWDKKMDQATLLEEAYKYVKYLQAQMCVLQSMPTHSHTSQFVTGIQNGGVLGELERLNRSQLLQVLVNSPVAQTMLYSQGFCVFSIEQLALLRKLSENRLQQQMSDRDRVSSSKTFFN